MANFIDELDVMCADEGNQCNWQAQFEIFESETQSFYPLFDEDSIIESTLNPWCAEFRIVPPVVKSFYNSHGHTVYVCYVTFNEKTYKATVTQKWW